MNSPIFWLIVATTLIRLAFAATTGLGVDESYMVAAGRVLNFGYFDHPPASWWLSWGASHLLGTEAPVAVRLPFILLSAGSQFLIWRIGTIIASERAGLWGTVAFNISPVFGVTTGTWVLPDGPLDTALLGATLCLLHALPARGRRALVWWTGSGLCAGLALFAKYSAILTIGGAFFYLVVSAPHRHWLRRPEPYIAAGLAFLVFSPVVLWNAAHGWASFAFQGDRAAGFRLRPLIPFQTLAGEAVFVLPWIWAALIAGLIKAFRGTAPWPHRLLACLALPPIIGFAMLSAWSSQRILYHWAAPGYLMLFPLLGAAIARLPDPRRWLVGLAGSAGLVLVGMTVIACQVRFDFLGGALAATFRNDPTAEALDWTSIRDDLQARGLVTPATVVASLNWRDAGKIGYGLGSSTTILCLNSDSRQFGVAYPWRDHIGEDALVLVVDPTEQAIERAKQWFDSAAILTPTSVRLWARTLRTVAVVRGHMLKAPP